YTTGPDPGCAHHSCILGPRYAEHADPGTTNFVPRPDWYFYFLFYLLRIFKWPDSVILGTIGIPSICLVLLLALPFVDLRRARPLRRGREAPRDQVPDRSPEVPELRHRGLADAALVEPRAGQPPPPRRLSRGLEGLEVRGRRARLPRDHRRLGRALRGTAPRRPRGGRLRDRPERLGRGHRVAGDGALRAGAA